MKKKKNSKITTILGCVGVIFLGVCFVELFLWGINNQIMAERGPTEKESSFCKNLNLEPDWEVLEVIPITPGWNLCKRFTLWESLLIAQRCNFLAYAEDSTCTKIEYPVQGWKLAQHYKIVIIVQPGDTLKKVVFQDMFDGINQRHQPEWIVTGPNRPKFP